MAKGMDNATEIERALFRRFIIGVLDDDNGISQQSFETLKQVGVAFGEIDDIIRCVDATEGRFYLKESAADELRKA